jgi:GNAT superfamily N-acetyltransferase
LTVSVRLAKETDASALARLFHAIDVHYWAAAAPTLEVQAKHVRERILLSRCEIALAEIDGRAVGLTAFAVLYPSPVLGGQLFMKDLFTLAEARGQGVGRAIMAFLARLAVERGCTRFDWTAETDNPEALAFYDKLGAKRVTEKVYFRFDGTALDQLASEWSGRSVPGDDPNTK